MILIKLSLSLPGNISSPHRILFYKGTQKREEWEEPIYLHFKLKCIQGNKAFRKLLINNNIRTPTKYNKALNICKMFWWKPFKSVDLGFLTLPLHCTVRSPSYGTKVLQGLGTDLSSYSTWLLSGQLAFLTASVLTTHKWVILLTAFVQKSRSSWLFLTY